MTAGLARLAGGLGRGGGLALDALLPPACLVCSAEVASQGTLCPGCFGGVSFVTAPLCHRCGVPLAHEGQGEPDGAGSICCAPCLARPPAFGTARAALRYDDGARRLILPLKHAGRVELAEPLAQHMVRAGAVLLEDADLLAAVPAHWRRRIARRYDQAALLARAVGRRSGLPCQPDLLVRIRATPSLGDRGAADRRSIVDGAFAVRRRLVPRMTGRRIVLVDDVMTSGATVEACSRALLAAGAASVDVLAAARVPDLRLRDA